VYALGLTPYLDGDVAALGDQAVVDGRFLEHGSAFVTAWGRVPGGVGAAGPFTGSAPRPAHLVRDAVLGAGPA
jgi:hypothetical protein